MGPTMSDAVKVTIYGEQKVRYKQEREISHEDWVAYKTMCEEDPESVDKSFEWLIEVSDVNSADEIEDVEIVLLKEPTK